MLPSQLLEKVTFCSTTWCLTHSIRRRAAIALLITSTSLAATTDCLTYVQLLCLNRLATEGREPLETATVTHESCVFNTAWLMRPLTLPGILVWAGASWHVGSLNKLEMCIVTLASVRRRAVCITASIGTKTMSFICSRPLDALSSRPCALFASRR
jgi:hypothetical protein